MNSNARSRMMSARRPLGLLASGALGVALAGCGLAPEEDDIGERPNELYPASKTIWQQLSIPVCWQNGPDAAARGWVKNAVETTWESVTYANFTGWGDCVAGAKGIRIKVSDEGPHVKALGRGLDGMACQGRDSDSASYRAGRRVRAPQSNWGGIRKGEAARRRAGCHFWLGPH